MKRIPALLIAFSIIFTAATVSALPTVSVDTDPGTSGIQTVLDIVVGDTFTIDVVIQDFFFQLQNPFLLAFSFQLDFNPAVLGAVSAVSGDFLPTPVISTPDLSNPSYVRYAEATFIPAYTPEDGVLASITFDAIGVGTSPLDLNTVILADRTGQQILVGTINDGSANVAGAPVPEPSTMLLLGTGLAGLVGFRRKFKN
jgi:hypothetical protein